MVLARFAAAALAGAGAANAAYSIATDGALPSLSADNIRQKLTSDRQPI
jgi:hypothetical protein